jgi:TPR repeat protein
LFNAGWCHCNGIGDNSSVSVGKEYYNRAAVKFGHFSSIYELGKMHYYDTVRRTRLFPRVILALPVLWCLFQGTPRSLQEAYKYFSAVAAFGPWAADIRKVVVVHAWLPVRLMEVVINVCCRALIGTSLVITTELRCGTCADGGWATKSALRMLHISWTRS